jgi:ATP-binding cassette, subfamily F, member 3
MLQVHNLSKYYGERCLFDEVCFTLTQGERAGLIGRNGHGKSTLFRIITGQEEADSGTISTPKGYEIGYLAQHFNFTQATLVEEAALSLRHDQVGEIFRAEKILAGLGFSEEDLTKSPGSFSGGYQLRINLAKLFLSEPDLLLLDEPTNYLDIVSIRWLVSELSSWKGELIIISHDRGFLESVTTHTLGISRRSVRKVPGAPSKLEALLTEEDQVYERTRANQLKKREETEAFIDRFRAKASKAALVQSRIKQLDKLTEMDELSQEKDLAFSFKEKATHAKYLLKAEALSFSYPQSPVAIKNLELVIKPGERLGIVGKNGLGKSTLLKLLANRLQPNSGEIGYHTTASLGFFAQTNVAELDKSRSVEEEIRSANESLSQSQVRGICGLMMFSGEDAIKKIASLSGGERSRVALGKLLTNPTNVLLLDEPTSHLDLEAVDALIKALKKFSGSIIIVSHSEMLLSEVTTRLIVFTEKGPTIFEGSYKNFLREGGWQDSISSGPSQNRNQPRTSGHNQDSKKELRKISKELRSLELRLSKVDTELQELDRLLAFQSARGNIQELQNIAEERASKDSELLLLLESLENLELQKEKFTSRV